MHILDSLLPVPPVGGRSGAAADGLSAAARRGRRRRRQAAAIVLAFGVTVVLVVLFVLIGETAAVEPPRDPETGRPRTVVSTDSTAGIVAVGIAVLVALTAVVVAIALVVRRPVPACPADATAEPVAAPPASTGR